MKTDETRGQGLTFVTCDTTGKTYPVPAGGSDSGVSVGNAGTVSGEGEGVQSTEGGQEPPAQEPTGDGAGVADQTQEGQGFLEPYLKDVPEDQRPVVEPILEKYRQEQDRNFNQRFEQLRDETHIPVQIHQALVQDPENTINWIADKMLEERGIDVRQQLLSRWAEGQEGSGQGQQQVQSEENDPNRPLTQAELDKILEERENQKQQELRQQQFQQQQYETQQKTVNSWVDDAAKSYNLPLDDSQGTDPLRSTIIMQANDLHEKGVAKGKAAVELAVESISKRFQTTGNNAGNQGTNPRVADGGTPPPAENIDVSDTKQRRARMEELFSPSNQ